MINAPEYDLLKDFSTTEPVMNKTAVNEQEFN